MNTLTETSPVSTPSKKRPRENETDSQRIKREKAAERQRRKRERDRAGLGPGTTLAYPMDGLATQPGDYPGQPSNAVDQDLTQDEIIRRDRIRAAARERQRKHRALVKQRKMEALGMIMGNDSGVSQQGEAIHDSDVAYRVPPPETQYLPPELHHTPPPPPPHLEGQPGEPPFPHIQGNGGQMFATTLLLSFSCAPLLKQHLLNNLQMTNEELASLEPIIAGAWEQWDRQRRQHYEHGGPPPGTHYDPHPPNTSVAPSVPVNVGVAPSATTSSPLTNGAIPALAYQHPHVVHALPPHIPTDPTTADLRARFQRTLVGPTPFQAQAAAAAAAVAAAQAHQAQAQSSSQNTTPTPTSVNPANTTSGTGKPASSSGGAAAGTTGPATAASTSTSPANSTTSNSSAAAASATTTSSSAGGSSASSTAGEIDPHLGGISGVKGES
ncbi:hypothetical protein K435DRAFT_27630 [Dendrothele bispora CBS 962.96]|uniref:Uncharacterized protein n=1 Tax=Dendrothele bispora (strain CBS 962.96) TaxID=1314807 RepID=A0A4V4HBH8_DENBC|nr:hypothetical protein K435DRAFT_27630 [Dendrothele bispora CBS 962.96]